MTDVSMYLDNDGEVKLESIVLRKIVLKIKYHRNPLEPPKVILTVLHAMAVGCLYIFMATKMVSSLNIAMKCHMSAPNRGAFFVVNKVLFL